jgi:phage terminase small subunit
MRGRPRKPTALKLLEGKRGHRALPKGEPQPTGEARAPDWLSVAARKEWNRLAPMMEEMGCLTAADAEAFGELCAARVRLRTIIRDEDRFPTELWRSIQAMEARFGLTPADRARISVEPKKPESKLARYLGDGRKA